MDLRQRIVEAYRQGEGSSRDLAVRFSVGHATVCGLTLHLARHGTLAPLPTPGRKTFWQPAQLQALKKAITAHNDATLEQLADSLAPVFQRRLDPTAIWRGLRRLGWTRKKKTSTPPSATRPRSKRNG